MVLANKVCLVTGAGRGIGESIAIEFARQGATLALCSRTTAEIQRVADKARAIGTSALAFEVDVSNFHQVTDMVARTISTFGKIDVLVNNAGIQGPIGRLWENNLNEWKKTIETNLIGTVHCTRVTVPHMIAARRGKIINLSGGREGAFPRFSSYACSKSAIVRLTETLAAELTEYNIQVNAIAPGPVNTRLLDQVIQAGVEAGEHFERAKKQRESGGVSPGKAAKLAVFLASERSAGLTGRLFSAVWDNWEIVDADKISRSSLYQMRRIDGIRYLEPTSSRADEHVPESHTVDP